MASEIPSNWIIQKSCPCACCFGMLKFWTITSIALFAPNPELTTHNTWMCTVV